MVFLARAKVEISIKDTTGKTGAASAIASNLGRETGKASAKRGAATLGPTAAEPV